MSLTVDCSDDFRNTMMFQLMDWRKNGQVDAMSPTQHLLVSLLAGDWQTCCSFRLNWTQFLGVMFWYAQSTSLSLEVVLDHFLEVMETHQFCLDPRIGSKQGKEGLVLLMQLFSQMRRHNKLDFVSLLNEQSNPIYTL